MEITEKQEKDIKIFNLKGRLDSNTSPSLENRIIDAMEDGARSIVINFEQLDYISSAGLRVILKATKDLKKANGRIMLCAMQDYVKEVFEIAGFDTFLPIASTMDEALRQL